MASWLVTGAGGMLGRDLVDILRAKPGVSLTAAARADLDITDMRAVAEAVDGHDVVVNAAAWTDVDGAESREEEATTVNGAGVARLARACDASGARLIHVSTDYVFGGDADSPYPEDAPTAPVNAYGRSKLAGEKAVVELLPKSGYVVRSAWLYGRHGPNFLSSVLKAAAKRDHVDVVDDQHGQPTWSRELARGLVALGEQALLGNVPAGIYHAAAGGQCTWFALARALFALRGLDPDRVRPITSDRMPRPAPRPKYSVLDQSRWRHAGLPPLRDWKEQLEDALAHGVAPLP